MPGTVQQLKDRLMRAIDREGDVLDMSVLVEVIYDLEHTEVTAEELTVTRLGLLINNVRRKMSDKDLAHRMKQLVKQWQKLVQNSQNGLPEDHQDSPSIPVNSSLVFTASGMNKPNDAHIHRKKILNQLSRIKKKPRNTPPRSTPPTSSSVPFLPSSNDMSSQQVTESPHIPSGDVNTSPISSTKSNHISTTPIINGTSHNPLIIRLPLVQLPQQQTIDDEPTNLIVSIPLDVVRLSWQLYPVVPPSLIVSIKRSLLSRDIERLGTRHDLVSTNSPLFSVSPITKLKCHSIQNSDSEDVSMDVDSPNRLSNHIGAPSGRLKSFGPPNDCAIGIDGCQGDDGLWYSWTDSIPSDGLSVTVLPYVYIDGYEEESTDLYVKSMEEISNS